MRPRAEVMRFVYVELLGISYGRDPKSLFERSSLYAISNVSYPELVEGNAPIPVLFSRLKELMWRLGHADLQLRDLLSPEFKRTRVILSEIVNFLKFRTDEEIVMGDDGRAVNATAFAEEHSRVREELERVQMDVSSLRQKQRDLEPIVGPKQGLIQQLTLDKAALEDSRRDLESEIKRLESELVATEEQTRRIGSQSQILSEKLIVLEQQVTASPGKVTSALQEAQEQYDREREAALNRQEKVSQLIVKYQTAQKCQNRLREALLLLQPYNLSLVEKQRLKSATLERHAQLLELEKDLKRLELSANNSSRELRKLEEQKARNQTSSESKLLQLEKLREEKLAEKLRAQKEQAELVERTKLATAAAREMEESLAQQDSLHTARILEIAEVHQRLLQALEKYGSDAYALFARSHQRLTSLCS